nr:hypothetical protein [Notoacmeibacter marinus]
MGHGFAELQLVALKAGDSVFISADDGRVGRVENTRQQALDLLLGVAELILGGFDDVRGERCAMLPCVAEHHHGEVEQLSCRLHGFDDIGDIALDLVAGDGLAVAAAALGLAEIIGIALGRARRPGTAQRLLALGAMDEAAQDEVIADVLSGGELGDAVPALLDLVEGGDGDQRLMMALEPVEAIGLAADMAGIERLGQDIGDPLLGDLARPVARELREGLEEAFDFRLRLEPACGVTLEGIANDGCEWLVRDEQLSMAFHGLVRIADRRIVDPVAVFHPSAHLLGDLSAILLSLQRALGGDDGFDELTLGRIVELEVEAFDRRLPRPERIAQIEMEARIAGKALQIVEDDGKALVRLGVEEGEQRLHAGPFHEVDAAGDRVGKDGGDFEPLRGRVLAAACLLAFQPVSVRLLAFGRHAAIDDRLCRHHVTHGGLHRRRARSHGRWAGRMGRWTRACPSLASRWR